MSVSKFTQSVATAGERVVQTLRHPTKRNMLYFFVIVWLNAINLYVYYHRHEARKLFNDTLNLVTGVDNYKNHAIPQRLIDNVVFKVWAKSEDIPSDSRRVDTHATNYDHFFRAHDPKSMLSLTFQQRCDAYFKHLYATDSAWHVDVSDNFDIDWDYQMSWDDFKKSHIEWGVHEVAKEKNIKDLEVEGGSREVESKIAEYVDKLKLRARLSEYDMRDYLAHMRIFNWCYVDREDTDSFNQQNAFIERQEGSPLENLKLTFEEDEKERAISGFDSCSGLQSKVYPWLHDSFPLYQRYTNDIFRSPPQMSKYISDSKVLAQTDKHSSSGKGVHSPVHSKLTNNKQCWLNVFKKKLSGKGIVIPLIDGPDVENTVNLIHVLRALGNKYPIQIVYYKAMKDASKKKLVDAARRPFTDFPLSYSKVIDSIPKSAYDTKTQGFVQQELWFVDAATMVSEHFQSGLSTVPIIAWAAVVNSFEEYILMDPLVVPLQNPQNFFDQEEYKQEGAYFYRARAWNKRDDKDPKYFNKMAPSLVDSTVFGIPVLTQEVLNTPFFDSLSAVQDSRLAIINRDRHFSSVMLYLQLAMYAPANHRGNNALEIWLAFALNGDTHYHFNKLMPAAVGLTTEQTLRLKANGKKPDSLEICSTQVGQIDPDSEKLTWIAAGFKGCAESIEEYGKEASSVRLWKQFAGEEDLKSYYDDRIILRQAIVPPFEDIGSLRVDNEENEPILPWNNQNACADTFFCGYSRIGGTRDGEDRTLHGQLFEFDSSDVNLYNFYGDIWVGSD